EFGRIDPVGRAILEEACRKADALDDGLRARLYARLARDIIGGNESGQGARALALCDEAARAARRAGDPGALAMALVGMYYASALRLRPAGAAGPSLPDPQEVLDAAEVGGDHESAAVVRHLRAVTCFASGDAKAFSAEVDGVATVAATSRVPE